MEALIDLLYKIADDKLILGHRNSEWTGVGPILEEDIAFASMAQDKVGQSKALYDILNSLGEPAPDPNAFLRNAEAFRCCQLVELPIGEYDFSLIRHFLFDAAELLRFDTLRSSSNEPLAQLARKFYGEIKYHNLHAKTWIKKLGNSSEEAIERLQNSLDYAFPYALGIFETSYLEEEIIGRNLFEGEVALKDKWLNAIAEVINQTQLHMPDYLAIAPKFGGRVGEHTEYLQPMIEEMGEVFRLDPSAEW